MTILASINWPALALFTGMVLAIALYGLVLSGHFPRQQRSAAMHRWDAKLVILASILAVAMSAAIAMGMALERLHAAVAVIGAGAALLVAPLLLQRFPDAFVDGKRGLIVLAAAAAALAAAINRLPG